MSNIDFNDMFNRRKKKNNNNNIPQDKIVYKFYTIFGQINISQSEIDEFKRANYQIHLGNVGATCYMNTGLMCLLSIPYVFIYCRKLHDLIKKNEQYIETELGFSTDSIYYKTVKKMCELCANIHSWNKKGKGDIDAKTNQRILTKLRDLIEQGNPLFQPGAQDAKDLMRYIVELFQSNVMKDIYCKSQDQLNQTNDDQYAFLDQKQALLSNSVFVSGDKGFLANKNINHPLSTLYDMFETETQCHCGSCKYTYQTSNFKDFPLEEVRKYRNNNNWMPWMLPQNKVTLEDCLKYNSKIDLNWGENAMYCNDCKQTTNAFYTTKQGYPVSEEQIFTLNRGKKMQFNVDMEIPEAFCMSEDYDIYYELEYIGIHGGPSSGSGHFWTNIKKNENGKDVWCTINDDTYSEDTSFNTSYGNAKPYIVRYKKIDKARFLEIQNNYTKGQMGYNKFTSQPCTFSPGVDKQILSKNYLYQKYIYDHKLYLDDKFIKMNEEWKKNYIYNKLNKKDQNILLKIGNAPYCIQNNYNAQFNNFNFFNNNMFNNMQGNMSNFQNNFIQNGQNFSNLRLNNRNNNIILPKIQNNQNSQVNKFAQNGNNIINAQWNNKSNFQNMGIINNMRSNNFHYQNQNNQNNINYHSNNAAPAADTNLPWLNGNMRNNNGRSNHNMVNYNNHNLNNLI